MEWRLRRAEERLLRENHHGMVEMIAQEAGVGEASAKHVLEVAFAPL